MSESATEEKTRTIETPEGSFTIRLTMDDMGSVYPGMIRYNIEVLRGTETVYTYAINSYEIPPGSLFDARKAAEIVFARLAEDVSSRPHLYLRPRVFTRPLPGDTVDVVILQGSPRRFGNSAKIASWCDDEAARAGLSSRVFYLQDMDIRPCIGCYVCYDQGYCPVDDDMPRIIVLETASLMVSARRSTNTVPAPEGGDGPCQWLHAGRRCWEKVRAAVAHRGCGAAGKRRSPASRAWSRR